MTVTVKRVWVRNHDFAILWRSSMDTGGDVPAEFGGRPGLTAEVNGHVLSPEATEAMVSQGEHCLCGSCEACLIALEAAGVANAERLALSPADSN